MAVTLEQRHHRLPATSRPTTHARLLEHHPRTTAPTPIIYNINSAVWRTHRHYEDGAIQRAFDTWMAVTCDGAQPNLIIQRGADYPNRDKATSRKTGTSSSIPRRNIIYFVIDPAAWEVDHTI